jgi:hypothetical protein
MLHALEFHIDLFGSKQIYKAPLKDDMKSVIPEDIEI